VNRYAAAVQDVDLALVDVDANTSLPISARQAPVTRPT
jgi:hypothetical protein